MLNFTSQIIKEEDIVKYIVALVALMCLVPLWNVSAEEEFDPDLVIYFDYEEFQGDTVINRAVNGHNGEINGDIKQDAGGKRGMAARFKTGSFIDMDGANFPEGDIPIEAITICAWVNCEQGDHHAIFNARASDSTWLIHPELRSEGDFRWLLRSDGGATIFDIRAGKVRWDEWLHYAGTYDGKDGILYIDGEEINKMSAKGTIAKDWGSGARVGYNIDNARPFTGLMDDFSIWKRALSQDEIKDLMTNGPPDMAVSAKGKLATTWGKVKGF